MIEFISTPHNYKNTAINKRTCRNAGSEAKTPAKIYHLFVSPTNLPIISQVRTVGFFSAMLRFHQTLLLTGTHRTTRKKPSERSKALCVQPGTITAAG